MLKINNLSKKYNKNNVLSVDNLSLELKKGEIFGFLGPNGAGKTTTIKMVTGILNYADGDILINDINLKSNSIEAKKNFGYVPDNHNVYDKLTGKEYINFIGDIYGVGIEERTEKATKLAEEFGLAEAMNKQIKTYSHGMKQKIAVIATLIYNPKLWILDEPMTGLDPQSAFVLKEKMKEHKKAGNTVFFSSHVLEVVEKICDRVAIINKGKLVTVGTIEELRSESGELSLEDYFLKITKNN